jgi:hypothetical protein
MVGNYSSSRIKYSLDSQTLKPGPGKVDILILGAGWTSTFLIPLLKKDGITYAATTTTGRDVTYKFKFQYNGSNQIGNENSLEQYKALPDAKTILVTFPLRGKHQSSYLFTSYNRTHNSETAQYQFIQLGSTGIFSIPNQELWVTRHSKYDKANPRAIAEDEFMSLGGCVLDLAGLWGGERQPRNWIDRVAATKEQLKEKTSLHMVHGEDVARGIVAVHQNFRDATKQRFVSLFKHVVLAISDLTT